MRSEEEINLPQSDNESDEESDEESEKEPLLVRDSQSELEKLEHRLDKSVHFPSHRSLGSTSMGSSSMMGGGRVKGTV